MSRSIEERIIQMRFENGQFERGIETSINSINSLKKSMNFEGATKGFRALDDSAKSVDMSKLEKAVETVRLKFTLLDTIVMKVKGRIADAIVDIGQNMLNMSRSLSTDQINVGWDKFAQKTSAVQTIMAATASKFSDTATQMGVVNSQLDKLNWFTDETSYNFLDMVNNIGKFTSNNIDLETSVTAMQGISNWAAISGANINEAGRAMYNLSQAVAVGAVKLIDWKSIENANMATAEFKRTVIETAAEMGELEKVGENLYKTVVKGNEISTETFSGFNDTLSEGWFTSEVLLATLNRYGDATNKLNEIYMALEENVTTSDIVSAIDDYTAALANARAEAEANGLTAEETAAKATEAAQTVAQAIADEWNISLEQATEWLSSFDNEVMQFGLKAFKAAQEAKTFQDAIEATKDAVSTGWMKSFELVFGDYLEAKELWTDVANELYDLFAGTTSARNEMLAEWKEMGGHEYVVDIIVGLIQNLNNLKLAAMEGIKMVFGELDATKLLNFTKAIHGFILAITPTSDALATFAKVIAAVLTPVDMLITLVRGAGVAVFRLFNGLMGETNVSILGVVDGAADAVLRFRDWFHTSTLLTDAVNKVVDRIIELKNRFGEFKETTLNDPTFMGVVTFFRDMFTAAFEDISNYVVLAKERFIEFFNWLRTAAPKVQSFEDIRTIVAQFYETVLKDLLDLEKRFPAVAVVLRDTIEFAKKYLGIFGDSVTIFLEAPLEFLKDILQHIIAEFKEFILGLQAIDIAVTAVAVGVFASLNSMVKIFESVAGAVKSVTGVFTKFQTTFAKWAKAKSVKEYAKAIMYLAIALKMVSEIEPEKAWMSVALIAALGAAIMGLAKAMDFIQGGKLSVATFAAIGLSVLAIVAALKILDGLDGDKIGVEVAILAGAIAALAAVSIALTKFAPAIQSMGGSILAFSAGVFLLVTSLKQVEDLDPKTIVGGILAVITIILTLGTAMRIMSVTGTGGNAAVAGAGTLLAFAVSVRLLITSLKAISKLDPDSVRKSIVQIGLLMLELSIAMRLMGSAGGGKFKAGSTILAIAISLNLLVPAIKALAKIGDDELKRAKNVILQLGVIFVAAVGISKLGGKNATQAGFMLIEMAAAITILTVAVRAMGSMDDAVLKKGVTAVTVLGLMMTAAIASSHLTLDAKRGIQAMAICLGILALSVWEFSKLPTDKLLVSAGAMSAMILSVAAAMAAISKMKVKKKSIAAITLMAAILAEIAVAIRLLTEVDGIDKALYASGAISMVLLALAGSMRILNNVTGVNWKSSVGVLILGSVIEALVALIAIFVKYLGFDIKGVLGFVLAIDALLPVLTGCFVALDKFTSGSVNWKTAVGLAALGIVIEALVAGIAVFTQYVGFDFTKVMQLVLAIDALLPVLSACFIAIDQFSSGSVNIKSSVGLAALGVVIEALVAGIAVFTKYLDFDFEEIMQLIIAISALLPVLSACFIAVDRFATGSVNIGSVAGIAALGVVIEALVGAIAVFTNYISIDIDAIMDFVLGISALLPILGACFIALDKFASGSTNIGSIAGIGALGAIAEALVGMIAIFVSYLDIDVDAVMKFVLAMDALLVVLTPCFLAVVPLGSTGPQVIAAAAIAGAAIDVIGGLLALLVGVIGQFPVESLEKGAANAAAIGKAVGGFFGGILGGLVEGVLTSLLDILPALGTALSGFMTNISGFLDGTSDIDGNIIENVGLLAGAVLALTAADFLSAVERLVGGVLDALFGWLQPDLKEKFKMFGEAVSAFAEACGDVSPEQVSAAAEAAGILGKLENSLPREGGVLEKFLGKKDLGQFGERLYTFGIALKNFAEVTGGITESSVAGAAAAGQTLTALENSLSSTGGIINDWFFGTKDLAAFGDRLFSFGLSLRMYVPLVRGITKADVEGSAAAGQILAALEKELVFSNGFVTNFLFGSQDLGDFGGRIRTLGSGLKDYAEDVKGITAASVQGSADAIKILSDIEKNLNVSGGVKGFWFGDNSFDRFATNLKALAGALKEYDEKIADIHVGKIVNANAAIDQLIQMAEKVSTMDGWAQKLVDTINGIITYFLTELNAKKSTFESQGERIIQWLVFGFGLGFSRYHKMAYDYGVKLANQIKTAIEKTLEIASPSAVMERDGKWIVKGLANGIDKDTSAEDAASKKASNIEEAFKSVFEKSSTLGDKYTKEFELWTLTTGANADAATKRAKEYEVELEELKRLSKEVQVYQAKLETYRKEFGEDSDEYKKAQNELTQSLIDMYNKRETVSQLSMKEPSVTMTEAGVWLVDSLAYGITSTMTAEEAAEQKAQNIEDVFSKVLGSNDIYGELRDLDYQLWQLTEGANADELTKTAKEYTVAVQSLRDLADDTEALAAKVAIYRKEYGENDSRYLKALAELEKSQIDLLNKQKEIDEIATREINPNKPSAVLMDLGGWMVKNIGSGITSDMSAEEAAAKKVQNISDAFQGEINKIDLARQMSSAMHSLWEVSEGYFASESDKRGKQGTFYAQDFSDLADLLHIQLTELDAIEKTLGKETDEYKKKLIEVLGLQKDMYEMRNNLFDMFDENQIKVDRTQLQLDFLDMVKDVRKNAFLYEVDTDNDKAINDYAAQLLGFTDYDSYLYALEHDDYSQIRPIVSWAEGIVSKAESDIKTVIGEDLPNTLKDAYANGIGDINLTDTGLQDAFDTSSIISHAFEEQSAEIADSASETMAEIGSIAGNAMMDSLSVTIESEPVVEKVAESVEKTVTKAATPAVTKATTKAVKQATKDTAPKVEEEGEKVGNNLGSGLKKGIDKQITSIRDKAGDAADGLTNALKNKLAIKSPSRVTYEIGDYAMQGLINGFADRMETLYQTSYNIGQQITIGLKLGIADAVEVALQAAQEMAQQVINSISSELGVESPSTVAMRIGKFVGIGLGNGMDASASYVQESSDNLASTTIDALTNARNQIETILNSDDDLLTLTPVLDMDALREQARSISSVLNSGRGINVRAANLQVGAIAARKSEIANQNGNNGLSGDNVTNYSFTQNNYSPKALSQAEIYRQTKNQFSQLKGRTKR